MHMVSTNFLQRCNIFDSIMLLEGESLVFTSCNTTSTPAIPPNIYQCVGVEGPCIIRHFRTAADQKAAREALLQMQPRHFKICSSTQMQETCRQQLLLFGKQMRLGGPREIEAAVEDLDAASSFCIPEAEARRVLHSSSWLRRSAML
jgi:hypothetical protein